MSRLGVIGVLTLTACFPATPPGDSAGESIKTARLGEGITLVGNEGSRIRVTALEVVDPAKADDPFFNKPRKGNRYVAIRLQLENIGSTPYRGSPGNAAVLVDIEGQEWDASFFDEVGPALGSPTISPGDERMGFITFEIPKDARIRIFQVNLESGFGPQTGEWKL